MPEQPPAPGPLTPTQLARLDFARRDLDRARSEDVAQLDPASLVLLVERLRGRLDDTLQVVDEITCWLPPSPPPH